MSTRRSTRDDVSKPLWSRLAKSVSTARDMGLSSLQAGALVVFVDCSGPLAPSASGELVTRAASPTADSLPTTLPHDCLFTVLRSGPALGFRSLASGLTLQAVGRTRAHRLANTNFGDHEQWLPHDTDGLRNKRFGCALGFGLVLVRCHLATDVKAFAGGLQEEVKQLRASLSASEARNEALARNAASAESAARVDSGRGWTALQAQLQSAETARAQAVHAMAQQSAALNAAKADAQRAAASAQRALATAETAEQRARDAERALGQARDTIQALQKQLKAAELDASRRGAEGMASQQPAAAPPAASQQAASKWCPSPATQPLMQLAAARGAAAVHPPPIPESAGSSHGDAAAAAAAEAAMEARAHQHAAAAHGPARKRLDLEEAASGKNSHAHVVPFGRRDANAQRQQAKEDASLSNALFMGLWQPCSGGVTPSVPRRVAALAEPRLAGWRTSE